MILGSNDSAPIKVEFIKTQHLKKKKRQKADKRRGGGCERREAHREEDDLEEQHAEGPDIRGLGEDARRALAAVGLGSRPGGGVALVARARGRQREPPLGRAEVADLGHERVAVGHQQHVGGLEVPVLHLRDGEGGEVGA